MAKVTASAFNAIQNKISAVVGTPSGSTANLGYNLTAASTPVTQGGKVFGDDVNRVIQDLNLATLHQTGSQTNIATFSARQKIRATDLPPVSAAVDTAYSNRMVAGVGELSIVTSDSYVNGNPWASSHTYRTRFDWGSNAQFRGWSNLGGFITIGVGMTGGSGSAQDTAWTNVLAASGNIIFGGDAATQQNNSRNGTFPNGGLYNILGIGQQGTNASVGFRIFASDLNYTGNRFTIFFYPYGGTNTFNCTGFEVLFELLDSHVATGAGPDLVTGTLGISLNTYYAYNKVPTVTSLGSTLG